MQVCAHTVSHWYYLCRVSKNVDKSEIDLYFGKRLDVRSFFIIKIDCLGTYNAE